MLRMPRSHGAWHITVEEARREPGTVERETVLMHVWRGGVEATVAHRQFEAGEGQVLILPPGVPYDRTMAQGMELVVVCCALCRFEFDDAPRVLPLPCDEAAASWMRDLAVFTTRGSRQREITDHLLTAILGRLKMIERRGSALKALHPGVAALQFLDDNITEPLTLQQVAAHAHISPSHLRTMFHRQVGSRVLRYQHDRRMQLALELLDQPQLSLREIARRCGYNDVEYFTRLFRRYH
jgi:AraC-like DNA-binding protein